MAKKHEAPSTSELKQRIERTRREGKYQQALDLVKNLFKAEPTPEHKDLLKDTYLQRAAQLRSQGYMRDAATVLEVAARLDDKNQGWIGKLAGEMARTGEVARTLALVKTLSEEARQPYFGSLVDGAILQGKAARDALPAPLQAEYDLVVKAFGQVEAGQDDAARDSLQGIGLKSPFLEWKVLIRGFQAYYANDDERARDNWQRLSADRLPARLAAPFRARLDNAYLNAQPPATRKQLTEQYDQFQANVQDRAWRDLRTNFAHPEQSPAAYRAAEHLVPLLTQSAPHLVPRLARCFYWSIVESGPDDVPRYRRVFGTPPDDLNFHRIQAIAFGDAGEFEDAHLHWQKYEQEIAAHPEIWPGQQGAIARALVYRRMGHNAALMPTEKQLKALPAFRRLFDRLPKPLKPSAEDCFQKAIQLVPTMLEAHEGLFAHHLLQQQEDKAIKAAEGLLAVFPDHVKTLDHLGSMYLHANKPDKALPLQERALNHNPLDRELRWHLQLAQSALARQLTGRGDFDQARRHFQDAVNNCEPRDLCSAYCQWAACELKAGNAARADELLVQARAKSPGELLVTYNLLVESNRLELGTKLRAMYTKPFNKEIVQPANPELAVALIRFVFSLDNLGIDYYGKPTHWKKIFDYALKMKATQYTEAQLQSLLGNLVRLDPPKRLLQTLIAQARTAHPLNPFFAYHELIATMGDEPEGGRFNMYLVDRLAEQIEKLAKDWPKDTALEEMLDDLRKRREMLQLMNPFARMFGGGFPFGDIFGGGPEEDDEEDDGRW